MNILIQKYTNDLRRYYRLPAVQASLTLVLSLFVMAIFIAFALRPTIISIVTLQKTITESNETLVKLNNKVKSLQIVASKLETIKTLLPILNTNIPNNGAMYFPLTSAVESIAVSSDVQLESSTLDSTLLYSRILVPFKPTTKQSVVLLPFSVSAIGTYPHIVDFLTKLLSMERIVMIESVDISKEVNNNNLETSVTLNFVGSAYYLADETQLQNSLQDIKGTK